MPAPFFTVTILYDNRTTRDDLLSSHGFSCLIENHEGRRVLFDTGESGPLLLENMKKLNIDPSTIEKVILSHEHYDHVGGVKTMISFRNDMEVLILPSFSTAFRENFTDLKVLLKEVNKGMEVLPGLFSTGEIEGIIPEQGLAARGSEKALFIGGCCHPGLEKMISTAIGVTGQTIGAALGGFHLCHSEDDEIQSIFQSLKKMGVEKIAPCHCTGFAGIDLAHEIYGTNCIDTGVGTTVEWF
jgi:7,8-dihydropterin-6-yl-methyl-4-(beta-D-ribofuranosyl)aminobenzene 5'-phosphate synthase